MISSELKKIFIGAYDLLSARLGLWLALLATMFIPSAALNVYVADRLTGVDSFEELLSRDDWGWLVAVGSLGIVFLVFMLSAFIAAMLSEGAGKHLSYARALRRGLDQLKYVGTAVMALYFLVLLGLFAFIIPAIFVVLWFGLSPFVASDNSHGVINSFKRSRALFKANSQLTGGVYALLMVLLAGTAVLLSAISARLDYYGVSLATTFISDFIGVYTGLVLLRLYSHSKKNA